MNTYILLLRGINVGKANRLPMATLKTVLENLGAQQVRTLLNSGNAIFALPADVAGTTASDDAACELIANQIAAALLRDTGLDLHCIVKTAAGIRAASAELDPAVFTGQTEPDPSRLLIGFSRTRQTLTQFEAAASLLPVTTSKLQIGNTALHLYCTDGINQCPMADLLVSKQWRAITCRNLATLQKIIALL